MTKDTVTSSANPGCGGVVEQPIEPDGVSMSDARHYYAEEPEHPRGRVHATLEMLRTRQRGEGSTPVCSDDRVEELCQAVIEAGALIARRDQCIRELTQVPPDGANMAPPDGESSIAPYDPVATRTEAQWANARISTLERERDAAREALAEAIADARSNADERDAACARIRELESVLAMVHARAALYAFANKGSAFGYPMEEVRAVLAKPQEEPKP